MIDTFERQERREAISKARKSFNYVVSKYMKVFSHHKSWIEGIFDDLDVMVEELKLGE